ncbi:unnamed protein product [Bemisia tabaci]|uniref:Glycine-rich protein n=1 Tax=Bemisia tabaci TaxID=7038 RepID=A0A9P0A0T1_BEMTA|nr:PREDICTED: uncharacterized protein LOC109035996 [Bemisia tabaci]CAH0383867.1 unnamed protein product [Bemisia tabaci]
MLAALIAVVSLLSVVATAPAKSPATPDSANEIDSANGILGKQVSASWGGYSATAGLGGGPNGGGLFAGAGAAGGPSASAGLGGGSGYAGATAGSGHASGATAAQGGNGQGFFDHIFAIPIGVLQSVNKFLNQKGNSTKVMSTRDPHRPSGDAPLNFGGSASAGGDAAPVAGAGYKPQAGVSTTNVNGQREPSQKSPTFYDNVFDIPISALRGVNQFLNGGRQP